MDRKIPESQIKKERNKKALKYSVILLAIIGVIVLISHSLSSSLVLDSLVIGTVDRGSLNITVNASGKVLPLSEEIIIAPINSRILKVYKQAGDIVEINEPILKLELASIETEYRQKVDEKEMKRRKLEQTQITLNSNISELEMQEKVKEMQLKKMHTELQNERYLDSIGASTADKIREIEMTYAVTDLELKELNQKIKNEKEKAGAEIKVQKLENQIFEKGLAESARLLNESQILSPQKATLTYINNQVGAQVSVGTQIAIVSDLSNFRIEAEISDSYASRLTSGARAIIKLGQTELLGTVVNITPSVTNGIIKFNVMLEESNNTLLRSGFSVDVHVEYGVKSNTLRLPNGSYYSTKAEYELWVIRNNTAIKQKVILGESSYDHVEIIEGLMEGDQVILSNMSQYNHRKTIKIK